jgi:spore coat protein CotH
VPSHSSSSSISSHQESKEIASEESAESSSSLHSSEALSSSDGQASLASESSSQESKKQEELSESSSSSEEKEEKNALLSFASPSFETRKIPSKEDVTSDDLFNLGNKIEIKIKMSDEELNKLQQDYETGYKSEIYRLADEVTISLTNFGTVYSWSIPNVGIRQKGNTSRQSILVDGKINTENHYKLSFDETFSDATRYDASFISKAKERMKGENYEEREFLGLDGLDFKWNRNDDETHIKEVYSSYLYKAGGIIAQRIGLSSVKMIQEDKGNKEYSFGLCSIYEPAKKQLIKKAFQNNKEYLNAPTWKEEKKGEYGVESQNYGDLYKCTWGVGEGKSDVGSPMTSSSSSGKKVGVRNVSGSYIPTYERKTNTEEAGYDNSLLLNAFKAFESKEYEELGSYVDMEYLSKVSAINYFLGNPDDFRYNYNNYMLYFRRVDKKMILIPIDNDRCLGIKKGMDFKNGCTEAWPYSKKSFNGEQKNPLLLKTICSESDNQCKKDYSDVISSLIASPWAKEETFASFMDMAASSYSGFSFSYSSENMGIKEYFSKKIATINDSFSSTSSSGDTTVYESLYIVGNFNSWGSYSDDDLPKYKFNYEGNYAYSITIEITKTLDDDTLQFKVNGGKSDYSTIDWSFSDDLKTLRKEKAGNAKLKGVKTGDKVSIEFNTNTLSSEIKNLGSGD